MAQFCPKCGTKDPDDNAVFCNKCGNRLPPHPSKIKEIICPNCKTRNRDPLAVFCDKCGSPLHIHPPVVIRHAIAPPPPSPPAPPEDRCPSCGAPHVDDISDYCNLCGAPLRGSGPLSADGEMSQQFTEKPVPASYGPERDKIQYSPDNTGPGTPVADTSAAGTQNPSERRGRRGLLKWGLIASAAVIILILIGASISGMIPGFNQSSNTTPAAVPGTHSGVAPTTQETAPAGEPHPTPYPVEKPTELVTKTVATTVVVPTVTPKVSATIVPNASAKGTTNASEPVATTLPVTNPSQPLTVGQTAYDGKGKMTVNDFSFRDKMSDPIPSYAVGKQYLIINITYENIQQNETLDADLSMMKVTDGGGYPYEPVSDIMLENVYTGKSILPKEKRTGNLLFIVPPGATYLKLEYGPVNQKRATFQLT